MSLRLLVTVHLQPSNETDFEMIIKKVPTPKLTPDFQKKHISEQNQEENPPNGKRSLQPPKPTREKLKHKN